MLYYILLFCFTVQIYAYNSNLFACPPARPALNTNILNADEILYLFRFHSNWQLLYRASRDGYEASDFHRKVDGYQNTIVFIKSTMGHVFGGSTNIAWDSTSGFKKDPEAFLFSLRRNDPSFNLRTGPFRSVVTSSEYAIYCSPQTGPTFGGGHDIMISNAPHEDKQSYSNFGYSYELPKGLTMGTNQTMTYLAGEHHFKVSEIEVFQKILA